MARSKPGRIITFYSYKGGTGRTMAISNVAWILASNGCKVLLIDWDLEAPGLHRYLRPFLADPELTSTPGLIDFVSRAARMKGAPSQSAGFSNSVLPSLRDYAVGVTWTFPDDGSIKFIPAGRQDENYAQRVNTFNWQDFYVHLGGDKLFRSERDALRADYDYILIDSRTGVSDTSSICTLQMPDLLVIPFTLNRQSIDGAAATAASIQAKREVLPIFPVPTRVEYAELDKHAAAIAYARRAFAPYLIHVQSDQRTIDASQQASYWRDVETPYVSFYAFEEILAAFKDETGSHRGLLAPNERISYWITDRIVGSLKPESEERRSAIIQAYAFKPTEVVKCDWKPHRRESGPKMIDVVRRWLGRRGWQYATVVLAAAILIVVSLFSTRMAALNSQLTDAVEDLREVQEFACESGASANFPKTAFTEGFTKLLAIQQLLNNMQVPIQRCPPSGSQDRSPKQVPLAPRRE